MNALSVGFPGREKSRPTLFQNATLIERLGDEFSTVVVPQDSRASRALGMRAEALQRRRPSRTAARPRERRIRANRRPRSSATGTAGYRLAGHA